MDLGSGVHAVALAWAASRLAAALLSGFWTGVEAAHASGLLLGDVQQPRRYGCVKHQRLSPRIEKRTTARQTPTSHRGHPVPLGELHCFQLQVQKLLCVH